MYVLTRFLVTNAYFSSWMLTFDMLFIIFRNLDNHAKVYKYRLYLLYLSLLLLLSSPCAGPQGLRAESARAVTGRRCPHSGVGEDFLVRRPGSPHENGRNSETKSRTLDPKVPKRNQRRGLRAPLCQKTGSHTKKRIFGPKSGFLGPKKKATFGF